jgi:adenine-specific DNA-methyltransferase
MDEVFGDDNFCSVITFAKTTSATSELLPATTDFLLWYCRDRTRIKHRPIYQAKEYGAEGASAYTKVPTPKSNYLMVLKVHEQGREG